MGVVQNIIGMVRDIHDRQENAKIGDAIKNNLNDPNAAVAAAMQIDPAKGMELQKQFSDNAATKAAADEAAFKAKQDRLGVVFHTLRNTPPEQLSDTFDRMTPMFQSLGVDPNALAAVKAQALADPSFLPSMDDDAYKQMMKDQYTSTVATPGSHVLRGGEVIDKVPVAMKPVTSGSAQTGFHTTIFDPNKGEFVTGQPQPDASGAPPADTASVVASTAALAPHFVQQESHGDYTAVSPAGALGAYQIMPATGRTIAARLGLAWRPDMMEKEDPASRKYQDAIGHAAISEAVQAGGGDPDTTFAYYHSGPDRAGWGPKTAQYVKDMRARTGLGSAQGDGVAVTPTSVDIPAAPPKPVKSTRQLSPAEVQAAGYPAGSVVQVDSTGKANMTYRPPNPKQGSDPASLRANYQDAKASIAELRKNITDVINDPDLGYATGYLGAVEKHGYANSRSRIDARVKQINTQKLLSLVKTLKQNGGNPFSRITNYEAQILPTTLGDFNPDLSASDFKAVGERAIQQLNQMEHDLDSGAQTAGFSTPAAPQPGEVRKGYRFKGGNPASQASWEKVQ